MAHKGSVIRMPHFLKFTMRYITPLLLLTILGCWFYTSVLGYSFDPMKERSFSGYVTDLFIEPNTVAWMSVLLILLVGTFISLNLLPSESFRARTSKGETEK